MTHAHTRSDITSQLPMVQADGPWKGYLQVSGRIVHVQLPDDHLQLTAPVAGDGYQLLQRQGEHPGLAKVTAGQHLRVEAPCGSDPAGTFQALLADLQAGIDLLEDGRSQARLPSIDPHGIDLEALVHSTVLAGSRAGGKFTFRLAASAGGVSEAVVEVNSGSVLCRTTLCRFRDPPATVRYALSNFLTALNSRIRVVRGSLVDDSALLEAWIPFGLASPHFLEQAIESLTVGSRVARRECAALLDQNLAHEYLQIQWKGE